jgi:Transposase DDE domain group 1
VSGNALQDEQVGQNVDDIDRLKLAGDTDRQAFVGKLVNDIEHPISASIVDAILDNVVGPDVIALLRPQPDARSVGQPEPAALGLLMGNLQPLASPDALDPLVVDYPARLAQQRGDLAIAVAPALLGKLGYIGGEGGKAAQSSAASPSQMGRFETQWLAAPKNFAALADLSGQWIDLVHGRRPPHGIVLDMDSSVSPTHGEQEMSVWNGHYGCTCYHPLFVFNQFGDLERCALRAGHVHSADGWDDVLKPVVARY